MTIQPSLRYQENQFNRRNSWKFQHIVNCPTVRGTVARHHVIVITSDRGSCSTYDNQESKTERKRWGPSIPSRLDRSNLWLPIRSYLSKFSWHPNNNMLGTNFLTYQPLVGQVWCCCLFFMLYSLDFTQPSYKSCMEPYSYL